MEKKVVKKFVGHSGCEILLIRDKNDFFVRKNGNVERNTHDLYIDWIKEIMNDK